MTQNFVRYSPEVEQMEPDFERSLQAVLDDMKQHMRGSLKTEGIGLVVRNAHAKGYGLARGEFEILSGMPSEYAQGIYAKPGRHEEMDRIYTINKIQKRVNELVFFQSCKSCKSCPIWRVGTHSTKSALRFVLTRCASHCQSTPWSRIESMRSRSLRPRTFVVIPISSSRV